MSDPLELKNLGNKAFGAKDYKTAIEHFSAAIALDGTNHVLFSNRSACHAALKNYDQALADGEKTIELKPDFWKGYTRKATPLYMTGQYFEARDAYRDGLKVAPENETLRKGVEDCSAAIAKQGGGANPFDEMSKLFNKDTMGKIRSNPQLAPFLNDPAFVAKMDDVIANPKNLEKYLKDDPRITQVMLAMINPQLGAGAFKAPPPQSEPKRAEPAPEAKKAEPAPEPKKAEPEPKKEPEPAPMEVDVDKEKALAEKNLGNDAYKKKDFEKALEHYGNAVAFDSTNIVYYLNRAAVYLAQGDYDKCTDECDTAVEVGRTNKCDYTQIGKALHRKGKALIKKGSYKEATEVLQKSLNEKRSADVLKDFQLAEKLKKKKEAEDYFDVDKSKEAKARGNEFFQKQQYPEAVKEYSDAILRNPKEAALYSNRAAAYTKLMAYNEALKDCDKCVELDPNFIKGYTRRATVHFVKKDYHKAIKAYEAAMKIDPNHSEVIRGYTETLKKIQETRGDKERADRAMADPEIQEILREDQVQSLLQLLKSDSAAAQRALQNNPELYRKFQVLMNAGLV